MFKSPSRVAFAFFVAISLFSSAIFSQMAGKPSASNEPNGAMPKKPASSKTSLPKITSRQDFDSMARTYHQDTPFALPHLMFVIDRKNKNKVYFVNSQRYRFHKDFLLGTYLIPRGSDVFKPIYIDQNRRFMVGTIAWQKPVEKFTWELWEGDLAAPDLIKTANNVINAAFYEKVSYKPNSIRQENVSADLGIDRVLQNDITKNQEYLALNPGKAVGRIHIIDKIDDTVEIGSNEIVVLKELPLTLPPVRGIIVAKPSTPLSHINILAKDWGVPNIYIKDADILFREYNTYVYSLDAELTKYTIAPASLEDIKTRFKDPDLQIAPSDLAAKKLSSLAEMRKKDSLLYGAKAANLGEMINRKIPGIVIPDGFSVPFAWYKEFMVANELEEEMLDLMEDNDFVHNPTVRRQKLAEYRAKIENGTFDETLKTQIIAKWKTQLGGRPVFVRSSSNAEDLPNFSGAGLYSSVPNVVDEEALIKAVKKVWASLWKFEAYEARVRNFVSQTDVYMSALVQLGVNMTRGGVMITRDPYNKTRKNAVYISAVCGHASKVVNNAGLPEQLLFNPKSNSVIVMTLSQQESSLTFDESGDLRETNDKCADAQGRVLNDRQARDLAKAAIAIRTAFGQKSEQDIEWGILGTKLYIVQARPYLD